MGSIHLDNVYQGTHYIVSDDLKVAYLPIAKNASTAISVAMGNSSNSDLYSIECGSKEEEELPADYYSFAIVRNPFDRLVSCYADKVQSHDDYFVKGRSHLVFLNEDKGFDHFVRQIRWIPDRLMDQHFAPQYLHLFNRKKECRVKEIFKYENLNEVFPSLQRSIGFGPLTLQNNSIRNDWKDYYTLQTAEIVYRRFKKDFVAFGYTDLYDELIDYITKADSKR